MEEGENPVEIPEEIAKEAGDAELKRLRFPIMVGKNRRNLVFLFTDMKRLRGMYDEEWSAFSQTLDKFIGERIEFGAKLGACLQEPRDASVHAVANAGDEKCDKRMEKPPLARKRNGRDACAGRH